MEREKLIREIEMYVECNPNVYAKAAFYGDPEVRKILEEVYRRWEESGQRGEPLDHATIDELRLLASRAARYKGATARVIFEIGDRFEEMPLRSLTQSGERKGFRDRLKKLLE
ncbi:MAG: hypothetical protein DRO12_06790 [Thermoprotei archaeon]|nr:MAG: hypothetical protein DRO12_06790 [Thermoprotei archaeon]